MQESERLAHLLRKIDGKGYRAYKDIAGSYDFGDYTLSIDHVQGDPFAAPSRVRVRVPVRRSGLPDDTLSSRSREIGLRDFLTRQFAQATDWIEAGRHGSGRSGLISIDRPGQVILNRTSVVISGDDVETRFVMGLPAHGRRINGSQAHDMFFQDVPRIVGSSLFFENLDEKAIYRHILVNEDADYLRDMLAKHTIISFIADGAVLPRVSGVDDRPMNKREAILFVSPSSLTVSVDLPNNGSITGMGIPCGITLIVGGGYHGKSTLLNAIKDGIYNHIPGDGREFVVTVRNAVTIRAEDGRRIERVDISPFIRDLPFGRDTREFCTGDASGSTSQAANIMEMLEMGAGALLIDEDTTATNFMIRDHRMQELVAKEKEPITPFIDKVRQLFSEHGVSTVLVIGGAGDYFDVADCVICMDAYIPVDCTGKARAIAEKYVAERRPEGGEAFGTYRERVPLATSISARKGKREVKIAPKGIKAIAFGTQTIDLGAVDQLVDASQTRAIGDAIHHAIRYMDGKSTLSMVVARVCIDIKHEGLDALGRWPVGDYAEFRPFELAAAINRLRTLEVRQE
jgi:predicted ABC-class ATPase